MQKYISFKSTDKWKQREDKNKVSALQMLFETSIDSGYTKDPD